MEGGKNAYKYILNSRDTDVKLYLETEFNGGETIDDAEELYEVIKNKRDEVPEELIFILDLDNPIAYSAAGGYEANGTEGTTGYTDIGDIGSVAFSEEPADIFDMVINF